MSGSGAERSSVAVDCGAMRAAPPDLAALERLLAALARRDLAAAAEALCDEVELVAEGDAALYGPREPVAGRARIAAALVALTHRSERIERLGLAIHDGGPALVLERRGRAGFAARIVLVAELDARGRIARLRALLS
jgi:hypothetical protein